MTFSHLDEQGKARMVDVSGKPDAAREAVAEGRVRMARETVARIAEHGVEKGDVLAVGRLAGIMGAKETPRLIPLCHPVFTTAVEVELSLEEAAVRVQAMVRTVGKTGPEMEALTGVTVACLAVYDMCKAVDKTLEITDVHLLRKTGGKSGTWERP
ncbi:MAG TPA: cyclic pyranopterin monophosphate synthase MoaC [Candidatus Xenobia bacterium]|jgi:cyclic pyranopterin phosphate synthase